MTLDYKVKFLIKDQLSPAEFALLKNDEDFWRAINNNLNANKRMNAIFKAGLSEVDELKLAINDAKKRCIKRKFTEDEWYLLISLSLMEYYDDKESYFDIHDLYSPYEIPAYSTDIEELLNHFSPFDGFVLDSALHITEFGKVVFEQSIEPLIKQLEQKLPLFDGDIIRMEVDNLYLPQTQNLNR